MQTNEKERSRKNDVYAKVREGEGDISNNNQIHNEILSTPDASNSCAHKPPTQFGFFYPFQILDSCRRRNRPLCPFVDAYQREDLFGLFHVLQKKEKQKSRIAGYFNFLLYVDNRSALTFVLFRGRIEPTVLLRSRTEKTTLF
jgi:hypothetical protein